MKTIKLFLLLVTLGSLRVADSLSAQTPSALGLQLYAGVSITGTVGTVYAIQATTNLTASNSWVTLDFLKLAETNRLWTDISTPATGRRFYRAVATAPTNLVFIPPGTFRMGSPTNELDRNPPGSGDEGPQTMVTLTKGFFMGKYEVTQAEYLAVIGTNPSTFIGNLSRPVEQVNWVDATNYCARRTQLETAAGLIPSGSRYRLPTEAEWEYACRAWTSTRLHYGEDLGYTNLANYAWFSANSGGTTHPVGQKLPNLWGLYDMTGNVAEWCQDQYGVYPGGSVTDPQGRPGSINQNPVGVLRGGLWGPDFDGSSSAKFCRSAWRIAKAQTDGCYCIGFRVVLAAEP